ncbi:HNH endonuclease [Streptococcus constellatus]|uniref:HNH endonuclease n=1 Tax=Streptococcus constellatus TaxID=76860 RepID=A0A564TU60_STRCV|nr:HNH endonuclease signature motif containing protein [Streptococcus constellatus]VUX10777.1 HNH endonuclease [Streptococcus constellatus]VUX13072.1 HNH endonuclease [Streptococcus gordonii]
MTKRPPIRTTINDIVAYWANKVYEGDLSVDWSEAHERCWRCAHKTRLERCHIIPYSLGGGDSPSNLVLLCKRCHLENPNVVDPEIMWYWLKAYQTSFYDTFWIVQGMEEYQKIYGQDFLKQLVQFGMTDDKKLQHLIKEKMRGSIHHFGEPHFNKVTVAGIFRMIYKDIIKNTQTDYDGLSVFNVIIVSPYRIDCLTNGRSDKDCLY